MDLKKLFLILGVFLAVFSVEFVFAATYTPNNNLFENTYSNNLIDMAYNQIENFTSKYFVVFQVDNNYYLVVSDDFIVNDNSITLSNSTIISAIRSSSSGYNYYYDYSTYNEDSTTISLDYIVISNIKSSKTISGKRFDEYKFNQDIKNIGIFILGIIFALFITKERKF